MAVHHGDPDVRVDDVELRWFSHGEHERVGAFTTFADGCEGAIYFDGDGAVANRPLWHVSSWEPMTITPSIRLTTTIAGQPHEHHGFITDGHWKEC